MNGNTTHLTIINLLAPSQPMEHLQNCLLNSACMLSPFVQMAKGRAEHSWRSVAETASMLQVVTEQNKMDSGLAVGTLASVLHAQDGAGGPKM